jgi:hypothetical protein
MNAEEVAKLIEVLKAAGVRSFKAGDVEITFDATRSGPVTLPRPRRLPTAGVLAEAVDDFAPSADELGAVE